jgi:hypothetical protein
MDQDLLQRLERSVHGRRLFQLPEILDVCSISKSTSQGCGLAGQGSGVDTVPELVTTTYTLPGESEGVIQCCICSWQSSADRNMRRFPIGFDMLHLGCSKCRKNKGCKRQAREARTKIRRKRFLEQTHRDLKDQTLAYGYEAKLAPTKKVSVKDELPQSQPRSAGTPPPAPRKDSFGDSTLSVAGSFCLLNNLGVLDSVIDGWILV